MKGDIFGCMAGDTLGEYLHAGGGASQRDCDHRQHTLDQVDPKGYSDG